VTIGATVAALSNPAMYVRHAIPSLNPAVNGNINIEVAAYASGPHYRLIVMDDNPGEFEVFSAPAIAVFPSPMPSISAMAAAVIL